MGELDEFVLVVVADSSSDFVWRLLLSLLLNSGFFLDCFLLLLLGLLVVSELAAADSIHFRSDSG